MPIITALIEYDEGSGEFSPEYFGKLSGMSKFAHLAKAFTAFGGNQLTQLRSSIVFNGVRASGTVTNSTGVPANDNTVTVGGLAYRFRTTLAAAYDVQIGASISASMDNLLRAINGTGTSGTTYFAGTLANPNVYATAGATGVVNVIARYPGTAGNLITLARVGTNLAVSGATLTGGTNGTALV